jgi:hypothetical protein
VHLEGVRSPQCSTEHNHWLNVKPSLQLTVALAEVCDSVKGRCACVAGWSVGWVSAIDSNGRTIWIADAHRDDGKRFVVHADEKLTAFIELESVIRAGNGDHYTSWAAAFDAWTGQDTGLESPERFWTL